MHAFACTARACLCTDNAARARACTALCNPYVCTHVQGSPQRGACTRVCVCTALQCCARVRTRRALLGAAGTRGALCGAVHVQGSAQPWRYAFCVCTHSYACVLPWRGAEPGSPAQAAAGRRGWADLCPRSQTLQQGAGHRPLDGTTASRARGGPQGTPLARAVVAVPCPWLPCRPCGHRECACPCAKQLRAG